MCQVSSPASRLDKTGKPEDSGEKNTSEESTWSVVRGAGGLQAGPTGGAYRRGLQGAWREEEPIP
eukprot:1194499-Prorocentrum_minimum.AAC.2